VDDLTDEERLLLEMLSVTYTPTPGDIAAKLTRGYARALGRPWAARHSLVAAVEALTAKGYLTRKYDFLVCSPDCVEDVTARLVLEGRLPAAEEQLGKRTSWREDRWGAALRSFRLALYSNPALIPGILQPFPERDPWGTVARGLHRPASWRAVPDDYRSLMLNATLRDAERRLIDPGGALAFLEEEAGQGRFPEPILLGHQWILRGDLEKARAIPEVRGWVAFLDRRYEEAQSEPFPALQGLPYVLTLIRARDWTEVRHYLAQAGPHRPLVPQLNWLIEARTNPSVHTPPPTADAQPLNVVLNGLLARWEERPLPAEPLERLRAHCAQHGYRYLVEELDALLQGGSSPLIDCLPRTEGWRRTLQALVDLARPANPAAAEGERVVWSVSNTDHYWRAQPKVQKLGKRGEWSAGRLLTNGTIPPCATQADRAALHALWKSRDKVWPLLVGHPHVFWDDTDHPVEIASGTPELHIGHTPDGVRIQLEPPTGAGVVREDLSLVRVFDCEEAHRKMASLLGPGGLTLPADAAESVQEILAPLSRLVRIVSDVSAGVEEQPADSTLVLRLRPWQSGLEVKALVQPLGPDGPEFVPGRGGRVALATLNGSTQQAARNLDEERARYRSWLERTPTLAELDEGDARWHLGDLEVSLTVLHELADLPEDVRLEWPEGQTLKVSRSQKLDLKVQGEGNWFAVHGEVLTDEGEVLAMSHLLEKVRAGERFVPLGEGRFLALTRDLMRRLRELSQLVEGGRLAPLAALALSEYPDLEADERFRAQIERMRSAEESHYVPPPTFQAELRAYQREGFEWLAQRAHWGVGACLADDMGLGKTIQTLALVVLRAPEGPTLVVAPTSVCSNWAQEAARFAPTLNVHVLSESDREDLMEHVGPFDLVVASYGLLTREADLLAKPLWRTLILDEAQAIKNPSTRRFAATMKLRADFRLATTGTPVENTLEELWTLFRFLNPGLLGSQKSFRLRFVEQAGQRDLLKRLVRPFLLRRTKSQVLRELPPRTDLVLEVELTPEERGLYEAIRQRAVDRFREEESEPLAVLAELTKLRRACCHPRLVLGAEAPPSGSKLEVLLDLLQEMRQGGHRALVFSQFVDHLRLVREALEGNFTYQYLDGSTPTPERARRIAAFQAGEGEVFLISLKAGGVGLNLTAADYVVHLDPWWNPAVEDQASDRAHRIGQQRPVTVYRLVAKDTVEERILELHRSKRELAESLLDETATATRLSAEELLRLLKE